MDTSALLRAGAIAPGSAVLTVVWQEPDIGVATLNADGTMLLHRNDEKKGTATNLRRTR